MPIQLLVKVAGTSHEEKSMVSFLLVKSLWFVRVCFVEVVEEDGMRPVAGQDRGFGGVESKLLVTNESYR